MAKWNADDIPDQSGRVAVVTGANSGLGLVTARELARHGARVVLGCRDPGRGEDAIKRIVADVPDADIELRSLDNADLAAVRTFADGISASYDAVDLLINNAGVMAIPRTETADGFEMQFGTNHLGHFALTGLLLPRMLHRDGARVVTVSSAGHRMGSIQFDNLQRTHGYSRWLAYGQSKLANLLFAYELQQKLSDAACPLISVAAHPGFTNTNLVRPGAANNPVKKLVYVGGSRLIGQSDAMGTLPQLYAATAPDVRGGDYFGPDGFGEQRGHPKRVRSSSASHDTEVAQRLWEVSEELTGVSYAFG